MTVDSRKRSEKCMSNNEILFDVFRQFDKHTAVISTLFCVEEEPDDWDKEMIERGRNDTSERILFEQAVVELGFDVSDL